MFSMYFHLQSTCKYPVSFICNLPGFQVYLQHFQVLRFICNISRYTGPMPSFLYLQSSRFSAITSAPKCGGDSTDGWLVIMINIINSYHNYHHRCHFKLKLDHHIESWFNGNTIVKSIVGQSFIATGRGQVNPVKCTEEEYLAQVETCRSDSTRCSNECDRWFRFW